MNIFIRPNITAEDTKAIFDVTKQIMFKSRPTIKEFLMLILAENTRLTKEVNIHREALDYEPLPTYKFSGDERNLS